MDTIDRVSQSITEHIPDVLSHFAAVTEQEPWIHLPRDYQSGRLGEMIRFCCLLALEAPQDRDLCRAMLHAASSHGEDRLERGLPDSFVFQELYVARESIWTYIIQHHDRRSGLVAEAILRIDMSLSLASKAALRGYHRPAFERRGTWPGVIDELVGEWRPPPPVEALWGPCPHDNPARPV
jgi:hypothetical protein